MSVARSAFSLTALSVLAFTGFKLYHASATSSEPAPVPALVEAQETEETAIAEAIDPVVRKVVNHTIASGETFGGILSRYGIQNVTSIVEAASPHKDLTHIRAGQILAFLFEDESATSISYALDEDRTLVIYLDDGTPRVELDQVAYDVGLEIRVMELEGSLWATAVNAGLRAADIVQLARIFDYEVDFNSELRAGARLIVVGDALFEEGKFIRFSAFRAVQLENHGNTTSALNHAHSDGEEGWYHVDGTAMKRAFLRSPLAFSRVTSGFNPRRYHPILKKARPHNGTDFGAKTGTLVRAVADGRVTLAGRNGGYGNQVKLDHPGPYNTSYSHLHRVKVRNGQKVRQGDIIGTVGSTGLATGAHLHYELRVNGKPVDAMRFKLPTALTLPASERGRFESTRNSWLPVLETAASPVVAEVE